jgi:peptidoglycan/LPS O-acetylase OafA/YrhL
VVDFFILSGLVLVLPFLGPRKVGTWPGYLVRRVLRLYPPVAVALVLSAVLVAAFPRNPLPGASYWYTWHDVDLTWTGLVHDLVLIDGTSMINSVLWSLQYEVAFSLLLPLVVLAARRIPPRLALTLPLSIVLVALGQVSGSHWAQWLPVFLVGVALAMGREDMHRLARRVQRSATPRLAWSGLTVLAVALLLAEWLLRGLHVPAETWAIAAPPSVALGGALVCFLVLGCPAAKDLFSGRFLQWAGRISFSLYLVHEPVIVSVASLVDPGPAGVLLTAAVGCAVSVAPSTADFAPRAGNRTSRSPSPPRRRTSPPPPMVPAGRCGARPRPRPTAWWTPVSLRS